MDAPWDKLVSPIVPLSMAQEAVYAIIKKGWRLPNGQTVFKSATRPLDGIT